MDDLEPHENYPGAGSFPHGGFTRFTEPSPAASDSDDSELEEGYLPIYTEHPTVPTGVIETSPAGSDDVDPAEVHSASAPPSTPTTHVTGVLAAGAPLVHQTPVSGSTGTFVKGVASYISPITSRNLIKQELAGKAQVADDVIEKIYLCGQASVREVAAGLQALQTQQKSILAVIQQKNEQEMQTALVRFR